MIEFRSEDGGQAVVFSDEVIKLFKDHKQLRETDQEAGGQLFALFDDGKVKVIEATGLREGDRRGRRFFWPNRIAERREIKRRFEKGMHFVGDWHTHPEKIPSPSDIDLLNVRDCYMKSHHRLNSFLLTIVGTAEFPQGLSVSIHGERNSFNLQPCIELAEI